MKSPSNWVNLQDYLGLNEETGQQMAGKVSSQVGKQAGDATNELNTAVDQFGKKSTAGTNAYDANAGGSSADAAAKAGQGYSGPNSLSDVDANLETNIKSAANRVNAANTQEGQVSELGKAYGGMSSSTQGGGGLDSFLLSGAGGGISGGGAMADLTAQYGDLAKTGYDANHASIEQGQKAADATAANQKLWSGQAATKQTEEDKHAAALKSFHDDAEMNAKFEQAMQHNTEDDINNAFSEFNSAASPISMIAEATGNRDPIHDYGTKQWNHTQDDKAGKRADGSTNGQHIWWQPNQKNVYKQMTPDQWAELNSLPKGRQNVWLEKRRQEIEKGIPYKKGSAPQSGGVNFEAR